jgi:predicted RNase H-like nuclease (RuvC/YqgF family)
MRLTTHYQTMKPDSPRAALLQQEIATLRVENEALKAEIEELRQHNHTLRLKVDAMARKLFGKSSEKLDAAQLQMVFDALQNQASDDGAKKPTPPIRQRATRRLKRHQRQRARLGAKGARLMRSSQVCQ